MKLKQIMPLLVIVAAFLLPEVCRSQTNASFNTLDVRTRETFRGPFYNYDTIFFKPLSANIPWQSGGDSLGWFLTTSKGADAKLCRVSVNTLFDTIFEIPFTETATNYSILSGSEGVAFTDLATNDTLALGTAVGRSGDIIFVGRTDQGHDTLVITGTPTFYYNETGYPTFFLGGSAAGCIIQSDGTSWYVTGVFYETAWERDYVGEYIYMKNEDDSLFVNGKATFDSSVYVEDDFKMHFDDNYLGYDVFNEDYPSLYMWIGSDTTAYMSVGQDTVNDLYFANIQVGNSSQRYLNFSNIHTTSDAFGAWESGDYVANKSSMIKMYHDSLTMGCGDASSVIETGVKMFADSLAIEAAITDFTGNIRYKDTFWDDMNAPVTTAAINPVSNLPVFDPDSMALVWYVNDSTTSIAYYTFQIPHRWKAGTSIYPHMHYIQDQESDTAKFWILEYKWVDMGENRPANYTRIQTTNQTVYTYSSGSIHQVATFPAISGSGHTVSSVLQIMIRCHAEDNDVLGLDFDIHYEIDKPGSYTQ